MTKKKEEKCLAVPRKRLYYSQCFNLLSAVLQPPSHQSIKQKKSGTANICSHPRPNKSKY